MTARPSTRSASASTADPLEAYRGRFAPSPTGPLHLGSLVTALAGFLDAKSAGGEWLVRIEDLDPPRTVPGAARDILNTLAALGLEWSGPVLYQSRRTDAYVAALEHLISRDLAYPCGCSRKEVAARGQAGIDGFVYPGTCRSGLAPGRTARAWRVTTGEEPIRFRDRIHGSQSQSLARAIGDFVVRRADGIHAYQLAVVVDDIEQGITHIVRGADLIGSTPRQIHLQRLLGGSTPSYGHVPLILDARGRKLSKSDAASPIDAGDPVPALLRAWSLLEQRPFEERPITASEFLQAAIARWDISRIQPHPRPAGSASAGVAGGDEAGETCA